MPKRTNPFQQLVALIQKAVAGRGAKVTESAIIDVPGLRGGREIDILVEAPIGPYHMKVAVETQDRSRLMDLTTYDSLYGKYHGEDRVRVNKVVVVTRRGFRKNVITKAQNQSVELMTVDEATRSDWSRFGPQTLRFRHAPHVCVVEFDPPVPTGKTAKQQREFLDEAHIFCNHGTDHGTVRAYAWRITTHRFLPHLPFLFLDMCDVARQQSDGHVYSNFQFPFDHPHYVKYAGKESPVQSMKVTLHAIDATGKVECSDIEISAISGADKKGVKRLQVSAGGKALDLMFPDGNVSPHIAVRIDDAEPTPKKAKKSAEGVPQLKRAKSSRKKAAGRKKRSS